MIAALIAGIHYLGIMLIAATLLVEFLTLKVALSRPLLERLVKVDAVYGIAALAVLVTGFLRITTAYGKGPAFYMQSGVFHAKVGLFILMGLLSVVPTLRFLRWRKAASAGQPLPLPEQIASTRRMVLIELHILAVLPFLAAVMARGLM